MPELSSGMTHRTLADIFGWVERNQLALPELQRPSVWGLDKIPRLLSSIYRDYPFGIMLIWTPRPDERIHCKPFQFQKSKGYDTTKFATHYLIDGQQRLTSFFRALHKDGDVRVAFNLETEEFALPDATIRSKMKDPGKYCWYDLRELLSLDMVKTAELYKCHPELSKTHREKVFGINGALQRLQPERISISFYNIHEKTYGDVAEIFERINLGTPVRKSQIALGKLSTVFPGVVGEVEAYLEKMRAKNGCRFDLDLFMTSFAVIATDYPDLDNLEKRYNQNGKPEAKKVERHIRRTMTALERALEFVEVKLFIDTMKYFPSERTLTFLAYLFDERPDLMANEVNANRIAHWTACVVLGGHHGDYRRLCRDISAIRDSESDEQAIDQLLKHMKDASIMAGVRLQLSSLSDMESPISRNNVLFGFLYAITRWKRAVSFPSGDPIKTLAVNDSDNEDEFSDDNPVEDKAIHEHHLYPAAKLKEEALRADLSWITKQWIYDLANFTFLTGIDNRTIKDPSIEYLFVLSKEVKECHSIDPSRQYRDGQYNKFITDRRKIIRRNLDEYLKKLEMEAGS